MREASPDPFCSRDPDGLNFGIIHSAQWLDDNPLRKAYWAQLLASMRLD